ncbi:hypothetical protein [Alkalibacillus silvisoli]|uniref:DUF3784 domain-containing protein n=1 Tax=Alkalibacillus silvisoli TaxID=392823 RepID=A0ABN1A2X7_9BACI
MPYQAYIVMFIGLFFMYLGVLIFTGKAPSVLDYFLKTGVPYNDKLSLRFFGTIVIVIGAVIGLLPFILGTDNMNL